jgi:flagellar secretion chaperone FliS
MNHQDKMEQPVSSYARNSRLAAYQTVSVHGGIADADPHRMIQMLLDAAAERMATARGCIERGEIARKARLLHSCVTIIAELRGSLNMAEGGALAQNLSDLYDYMIRRLLLANISSDAKIVAEVAALLEEVRGAWIAIGPEVRKSATQSVPAAMFGAGAPAAASLPSANGAGGMQGR